MRVSHGTSPPLFLYSMTKTENKQINVITITAIFMGVPHFPIPFTHVLTPLLD